MPPVHVHTSGSAALLIVVLLLLLVSIARAARNRRERREMWENVMANARAWAESVGGRLERVSEQPAVYGTGGRNHGADLIARRYRVTFIDGDGAECVALLRYTSADGNWAFERLTRDAPLAGTGAGEPALPSEAEVAAQGYARRHRAKSGNVPVIFAPPKSPKPPRRSS